MVSSGRHAPQKGELYKMQYIDGVMAFDTKNNKYKRKENGKWVACKFKDLIQPAIREFDFIYDGRSLKRLMKDCEKYP
ncbi:hypothetical protein ES707_08070 [subsurface metagenome]